MSKADKIQLKSFINWKDSKAEKEVNEFMKDKEVLDVRIVGLRDEQYGFDYLSYTVIYKDGVKQ